MGFLFNKSSTISNTQNKVGALRIQSSTQGLPLQLVYGTNRISPNLIWYGDFTAVPHTETSEAGGKGGGQQISNTSYTYTTAVALGLGEGAYVGAEDQQLLRVWAGKDIKTASELGLSFFGGGLGQNPWGYLVTNHADQALFYPFYAYVAAEAFPLGESDSLPNLSFEVRGIPTPQGEAYSVCTPDANPGLIMEDLINNARYGFQFGSLNGVQVDVTDFADYCSVANFFCSPVYAEQRPAADILEELALMGNSAIVWSYSTPAADSFGIKVVPYGDLEISRQPKLAGNGPSCSLGSVATFTPNLTPEYSLTNDDFLAALGEPPVRVIRKRQADTYNVVQIECLDRGNSYNSHVAEAKDLLDIQTYGVRAKDVISLHAICDPEIGRALAQVILQRNLYIRNTYEFTVGWKYGRLEPMDIVALTDINIGFTERPVRIVSITESESGQLSMTAEDLSVGVSTPSNYGFQNSQGYVTNNNVDPGQTNDPVVFQPPVSISGIPQIWIGASGGPDWGGAQVWASDDDASYSRAATITNPARYGELTANFPAHNDPDTVNTLSVDLTESGGAISSATVAQADAGDTLTYLEGELIAYTDATLTAPFEYDLDTYIRRGQKCTVPTAHLVGAKFMRLDSAVQKVDISESRVGSTIYLKLLSFNKTGGGSYTLDQVTSIPYVVQPVGVVVTGGAVPSTIAAGQVLCIPPDAQYSVLGRMTCDGRINCDGTLIVT